MGKVRPLTATDMPAVAALFQRVFRHSDNPPARVFIDYLHHLYLSGPNCTPDIPSLVHVADDGSPSGFVGRHAMPMRLAQRPLRAALLSSIMVDPRLGDPLIGARLLKAAIDGPQDFCFSETASEVSTHMWQRLGGRALPGHSLDWIRIISPCLAALETAATRHKGLRILAPIAARADRAFRRRMSPERLSWLGMPSASSSREGVTVQEVGADTFAELSATFILRFSLRPDWSGGSLLPMLREAMDKPLFGDPVLASVCAGSSGQPIGGFFYHYRPRATARVVQILAAPGAEASVLTALLAHAAGRMAASVTGRVQPFLMEAMLGKRIGFINSASSVIHCRDPDINAAILTGDCLLNGLAGEQWSRLIGGHLG